MDVIGRNLLLRLPEQEFLRRYACYIVGLYIVAFGISMIFLSGTGTSPVSSWAFVMDNNTPLTAGTYTFIINIAMILGSILILHKHGLRKEKWNILLQIPFSALFGIFIDSSRNTIQWGMDMLGLTESMPYWCALVMLFLGIIIQAWGIFLEVRPHVTMMSAEAFVNYFCSRAHKEFGAIKVWFDVTLVTLGVLCSIAFACDRAGVISIGAIIDGVLGGVREGTIIAALLVGRCVTLIKNRYGVMLDNWFVKKE